MKIANFNQTPLDRIKAMNNYLKENHGVKVSGFHTKNKLETVREKAEMHVVRLRNTNKKFNLDPEYAKYLGVRDVIDTMLEEGVYADSPALEGMRQELNAVVQNLMDGGYTVDEACAETMNRYRQDPRYAYDDEFVLPIVIKAAKAYESSCNRESIDSDINEPELRELAKAARDINELRWGNKQKEIPEEDSARAFAFASAVASKDIEKGDCFSSENISWKRPGVGYFKPTQ